MKKSEFNGRLLGILATAQENYRQAKYEHVNDWFGQLVPNVFTYGAISERCMERQLKELKGTERQTTFMSDLSIGEWFGFNGVIDTVRNAVESWRNNKEYIAEFILCLNWKAWEHDARKKKNWVVLYSFLYDSILELMYDYYSGNEEKTSYLWKYLD